jgi:hypothetical protein
MVVPVPPRGMLPRPSAGGLARGALTAPAGGLAGAWVFGVAGWAGGTGWPGTVGMGG